jgi:hypothetical protein
LIVINGGFTVPGGNTFTINANSVTPANSYVTIWVKGGKFTTSGSGKVDQAAGTHVNWIVDGDITVSGDSYLNGGGQGHAADVSFVGVGIGNKVTVSGSGAFIGTINAPGFAVTISGSGAYIGAIIGSTLTVSGSGGLHYDEALRGANHSLGNYSYASWFEDNSHPGRGVTY